MARPPKGVGAIGPHPTIRYEAAPQRIWKISRPSSRVLAAYPSEALSSMDAPLIASGFDDSKQAGFAGIALFGPGFHGLYSSDDRSAKRIAPLLQWLLEEGNRDSSEVEVHNLY
jgi:hypothetical protein